MKDGTSKKKMASSFIALNLSIISSEDVGNWTVVLVNFSTSLSEIENFVDASNTMASLRTSFFRKDSVSSTLVAKPDGVERFDHLKAPQYKAFATE